MTAAGDFEPCWNRHTYSKSNYDWSCAEPAHGSGFCTFSASLSTNPVTGEAFVRSVCLKHAHPQCGTSRALREDLRKELEAACDELEGAAKAEFVRLRRGTRGSTSARDEGIAPHVAQQLVVWDVWIAAGKDRARQFEQALLAGGQAAEGYPVRSADSTIHKELTSPSACRPAAFSGTRTTTSSPLTRSTTRSPTSARLPSLLPRRRLLRVVWSQPRRPQARRRTAREGAIVPRQ